MDEIQNSIYGEIVGDYNIHILSNGYTQDSDFMAEGVIITWKFDHSAPTRETGIMWDQSRILVYVSQTLTAREVDALTAAGFLVDDGFCP